MGNIISSSWLSSSVDDLISSSLRSSQLVYRHTLSTCYDSIFDVSVSEKLNSVLISDDGRLRLFKIDVENGGQLIEATVSSTNILNHEQIHDIRWNTQLNQFLVLTSKRLTTFDNENNFVNLDLGLTKDSPPFWRMTCWSTHLVLNLGFGKSIRYHHLVSSSLIPLITSWTLVSLGYTKSDLLSSMELSPQLILGINVELAGNRHIIDLFSMRNPSKLHHLKRFDSNESCPLDIITSLRDYTWLCKSYWPADDCLCRIESDGQVKKIQLQEDNGYILNLRLLADQSHLVIIRTPNKLPKEIDTTELDQIEQQEDERLIQGQQTIGKLPGNLLLEVYKVPSTLC